MICHATGIAPNRQYRRKNFVQLITPLGALMFRDKETAEKWVARLPEKSREFIRDHDPKDTPGVWFFESRD